MSANYGTTKFSSNKQEKRVARNVNGRLVIASGALDEKGDVVTDDMLFECKTTKSKGYVLKAEVWLKVYREAIRIRKCPIIYIDLKDFIYGHKTGIVVMRRADFDYYNVKSGLMIKIERKKEFNKQLTLKACDSHTVIISSLIEEELVVIKSDLFLSMIEKR